MGELSNKTDFESKASLLLLLYIEIFPIIIQEYQIEVEATLWGQGKCVEFLQQVLIIEQQMQPIFDKILSLSKEILISEQARDRILSKLMSGELEVLE